MMKDDMKKERDRLVGTYRTPRSTPRFRATSTHEAYGFEDPAPPWVPALVDAVFAHTMGTSLQRSTIASALLAWCSKGDPVLRAEQVITIINAWPGPRNEMLGMFVEYVDRTGAGARAGTRRRSARAVMIPGEWPEKGNPRFVVSVPREGSPMVESKNG